MENNKLDKRTKWSYCIGATGRDMAYALVSMFLLTYIQYTMKLTVAQYAVISAIMVVCLLWDAINDPMMGIIIENSHLKAGKFKPWIFIGAVPRARPRGSLPSTISAPRSRFTAPPTPPNGKKWNGNGRWKKSPSA